MKKLVASIVLLLAPVSLEAGRRNCCNELIGVTGVVQLSPNNTVINLPLPLCLSQNPNSSCGTLTLNTIAGCGFKVQNGCLTFRDDSSYSAGVSNVPGAGKTAQTCVTNPCNLFGQLVEAILEFDVIFDKPFKHSPSITTSLEVVNPFGSKNSNGTFTCPLVGGGTVVDTPDPQLGYINDVLLFVSNVTPFGFKYWFDVKFVLNGLVPPQEVLQAFISAAVSNLHFHAIATR